MIFTPDLRLGGLAALALAASAMAAPPRDGLADAAEALARGDGIAAEVAAEAALDAGAPRSEVAALIGEAELLQGDLGGAREWLGSGQFSAPTGERGFHALGRLELADGDLAAAGAAFDRALGAGSGSAGLWVDIGRLRYLAGQHHLAVEASARAVRIDSRNPRALEFQAQLIRDARGVRAALPWFERALEEAPDDMGLLGEYAATLGEAGRHRDTLRVARRMVELDPRHPRAYYLQAVIAARAGLDGLARRLLSRTNGAYDDVPAGQLLTGVLELRTGNAGLAVERFDALARRQPENGAALVLLGRALLAHGEANEVVARLGPAAEQVHAGPYLLALVGRAYEQMGRRQEAARYLDRAAAAGATTVDVLGGDHTAAPPEVAAIRQALREGQAGVASGLAARLRDRFAESIDVEILSGDVALVTGDAAAALAFYRTAAKVRRDLALVERMVAAHRTLGDEEAGAKLLSEYLAQNPRSAAASALLGRLWARREDWRRAGLLLEHADELAPGDAGVLADLAQAKLALGDAKGAEEAARRAYRLHRSSTRAAMSLARALEASQPGDPRAQLLLAKARTISSPPALAGR